MKVNTDGVFLGAWANADAATRILDIGTGTGVIALMMAQKNQQAELKGGAHGDNLSVVAVRWEDAYVEDASSAISTQTMSQEEVTTRLDEFGRNPSYKSDLSENEIELAIEEIRAAIDKYTPSNPKK